MGGDGVIQISITKDGDVFWGEKVLMTPTVSQHGGVTSLAFAFAVPTRVGMVHVPQPNSAKLLMILVGTVIVWNERIWGPSSVLLPGQQLTVQLECPDGAVVNVRASGLYAGPGGWRKVPCSMCRPTPPKESNRCPHCGRER
jgi:hypothetical protein